MSDTRIKSRAHGNGIKRQSRPRAENKPAINPIKKRVRDLNRLLEHKDSLPADVRLNYERELASCRYDLENAERARNRSRMIQKYHMVRFFERKKATKLLKRARTLLSQNTTAEDGKTYADVVHACEVDLNYTLYYPLHMVYTSLYTSKSTDKKSNAANRDGIMWSAVEQAMASGRLKDLREGKLEGYRDNGHDNNTAGKTDKTKITSLRRTSTKALLKASGLSVGSSNNDGDHPDDDDDDNDNGAGFFEQ